MCQAYYNNSHAPAMKRHIPIEKSKTKTVISTLKGSIIG